MLLSEMFGVERDEKFMVDGMCGEYRVGLFCEKYEKLLTIDSFGDWIPAKDGLLCVVIDRAPSGIIHLPPPLTDEQRAVLMSLFTMGARYMGMTQEGWKRCFVNKPGKNSSGWTCGDTQALTIAHGMANCLDSLVSWSDPEPFDIAKALGVEGC